MDTGGSFLGVKRPGCKTIHSPSSSAKVKKTWIYTVTSLLRFHGVVLSSKNAQGQLYHYLYVLPIMTVGALQDKCNAVLGTDSVYTDLHSGNLAFY